MGYSEFLETKKQISGDHGFEPGELNPNLYNFQQDIVRWALNRGRGAIFSDCGTGKSLMQLTWANQIRMHTNNPVLVLTPLAVGPQTVQEGEKFGIECIRSKEGKSYPITVTNYERLHYYNPSDFAGVVLDESSILKNFAGEYRKRITEFLKKVKYRLLATATAAPNDYFELGTSSEALGYMGFVDMLGRFFVNNNNNCAQKRMYGEAPHFRLKGHAQTPFWQWVASWSIALRKPSDMGYDDGGFNLPDLKEARHVITARKLADGHLFNLPANNLIEQRDETRRTIEDRCERAAELVNNTGEPAVIWCHLNNEGDLLEKLIPDAIQVAGKDKDDAKEEKLLKFANNQERVLITKPKIGAWGLNLQHCNHVVYFPSHSYESYYQAIRRCYRFGQKRPVTVDLVMSEGQLKIMDNLQRKSEQADRMFDSLISEMHSAVSIEKVNRHTQQMEAPTWL